VRVRAATRSGAEDVPEGVEQVAADVGTAEGARRACEGAAVVYRCAQPPYTKWPELFPTLTRAILDGAAEAGAKLVFADNLYMYGPPDGPMTEETPQRATGRKGHTRIEMAAALLRAHGDGRVRVTIGRSSDYYGPRGTGTTVGDNLMKPALRGKRARWLGSLDQSHTLNYLEDMARAIVTLGERDEADGQVWHLPAAEPLTGRQFLELVFEAAGHPPKIRVASRPMLRIAGLFNPFLRELNETLYQFERPFVTDASKCVRAVRADAPSGGREAHGGLVPAPVHRVTVTLAGRCAPPGARTRAAARRARRASREPATARRRGRWSGRGRRPRPA
jgi:nucleoside-diphosphate-sugar epimerase